MPTVAPALPADAAAEAVQPFRWTRAQYDRLVETGVLGPDDKVELIEGQIVYKMPQNRSHRVATSLLAAVLQTAAGDDAHVQVQAPIALSPTSEPEPDAALVAGSPRDYDPHPSPADLLLLVEVADSSLYRDRVSKASIYALAGIAEYWIVNLPARVVEVHRDPADGTYRTKTTHAEGDSVAPAARPDAAIPVADLLP